MPDPTNVKPETATDNLLSLAQGFYNMLAERPAIAMIAIALAFLVIFVLFFAKNWGILGKVLAGTFVSLLMIIVALGAYRYMAIRAGKTGEFHKAAIWAKFESAGSGIPGIKISSRPAPNFQRGNQDEFDNSVFQYDLLFEKNTKKIGITIENRQPIACADTNADDFDPEFGGSGQVVRPATTFWLDISKAVMEDQTFNIELKYLTDQQTPGVDAAHDRLLVTKAEAINADAINLINVNHQEGPPCLDNLDGSFFFALALPTQSQPVAPVPAPSDGFLHQLFSIGRAFAQSIDTKQREFLKTTIGNSDTQQSQRLDSYLENSPERTADVAGAVLLGSGFSNQEQAEFIGKLRNLPPQERPREPAFLNAMFALIVNDDPTLRAAAARYLRAPQFVDEKLLEHYHGYFEENTPALKDQLVPGRDFDKAYLLAAAGRDIHYNFGIKLSNQLADIYAELPDNRRVEKIAEINDAFAGGQELAEFAPAERKVLFAKLDYGTAYALYRVALYDDVLTSLPKADSEILEAEIAKRRREKLTTAAMASSQTAIEAFKTFEHKVEIGDNANRYAWKHHIKQAKRCSAMPDQVSYNCLTGN